MKITLGKVVQAVEPLQKLFNESMPIKTTFKLKKLTQEINDNLKIYDESRNTLLKNMVKKIRIMRVCILFNPKIKKL